MARKKGKQPAADDAQPAQDDMGIIRSAAMDALVKEIQKPFKPPSQAPVSGGPSQAQSLVICRNKHWRYISSFHGPWLQLPVEILETIANANYNSPRPRPIDPATFFDVVKIRRLVDEATNLAVRAASDIASPVLTNVNGPLSEKSLYSSLNPAGPGHGAKLSRERKFRMREQASQKLGRAFRLDEIACSVATMQGASSLEEVAQLVLQRNQEDLDAKYVHFFHEKIPSRQLVECTSLKPLSDIIAERPNEGEPLRTRAMMKVFRDDHEGAAQDLTRALSLCRFHQPHPPAKEDSPPLGDTNKARRRPQEVFLAEKDHPSSLHPQLLFHRGTAYLSSACRIVFVEDWMDFSQFEDERYEKRHKKLAKEGPEKMRARHLETRKLVKTYAKRALRDYLAFLANFEYSPNLPVRLLEDFHDRVNAATHSYRRHSRPSDSGSPAEPHTIYNVSQLFASVPPADLPEFPTENVLNLRPPDPETTKETCEYVTYHPLLTDALHSILLCHALIQTAPKEMRRHAYMVARLVRIADGYPIFQSCRSPSRSDWIVVVRRTENWLELGAPWNTLCTPAPLPFAAKTFNVYAQNPVDFDKTYLTAEPLAKGTPLTPLEEKSMIEHRERLREQAMIQAIEHDSIYDDETFRTHYGNLESNKSLIEKGVMLYSNPNYNPEGPSNSAADKKWGGEDYRDFPLLTPRATAIVEWVRQAPQVPSILKKKKKPKKAKEPVNQAMENLDLEG